VRSSGQPPAGIISKEGEHEHADASPSQSSLDHALRRCGSRDKQVHHRRRADCHPAGHQSWRELHGRVADDADFRNRCQLPPPLYLVRPDARRSSHGDRKPVASERRLRQLRPAADWDRRDNPWRVLCSLRFRRIWGSAYFGYGISGAISGVRFDCSVFQMDHFAV